ncbi:MAG TPA: hypothetical protein EYO01_06845 [Phycisphaerales bacterium]|nr:hypothetical protein [Phycisphaerales bacterium]HIB00793.1 hypothetical protein [Phycisphaerales bacterium]HIB50341.1 hypothetical protein [Phycisphaerales bacterium]HIN84220.1 hypothetical protein [Phycisphaerales bacterium]HIO19631.1 hypothetical protein [Phycisphaerales bacterium]
MNIFFSLCSIFLVGCANTFTGSSLKLEMIAPQQAVLLTVVDNETLSYAGGLNAIKGVNTWQGKMNGTQRARYESLLVATRWTTNIPVKSTNLVSGKYKIRIQEEGVDVALTLPLTDVNATNLYDFLQEVATTRLERHLKTLPKPNADVIIDRNKKE